MKKTYDVVHERLVLIHLPQPLRSDTGRDVLTPEAGGTIALQRRLDLFVCYPEHPSWKLLLGIFNDTFHAAGGNEFVGRSLAGLLRSAGAESVDIHAHVGFPKVGEYQRTHLLSLIESMRDRVLASERIGEAELRTHMAALSDHLSDPETTLIDKLIVQAWGQKPS